MSVAVRWEGIEAIAKMSPKIIVIERALRGTREEMLALEINNSSVKSYLQLKTKIEELEGRLRKAMGELSYAIEAAEVKPPTPTPPTNEIVRNEIHIDGQD